MQTEQLIRAVFQAYVAKDRAALEPLIAEPFSFTSPYDDHIDRATYFERCWPNSEHLQAFEFARIFVQGNQAYVTYVATRKDGTRFTNTEFFMVAGGQVTQVEVYFGWDLERGNPGA
ncbi:MAG: ketosteroid isomerase [Cyanobacteria bacterium RYN_339]|nr:ketosteroid isomerase [Cyanobacteria bacterium RYN_339]